MFRFETRNFRQLCGGGPLRYVVLRKVLKTGKD